MARTKKTSHKPNIEVKEEVPEVKEAPKKPVIKSGLVEYKLNANQIVPPDGFPIPVGDHTKTKQTMLNLRPGIIYSLDPNHPATARYEANGLIVRV